MRPKNYKRTSTVKKTLTKSNEVVKLCDKIQVAYASVLEADDDIVQIHCNVPLEDVDYTTDFLCEKTDGSYCVRECVFRKKLLLPRTCKLLDISREYWLKKGITDWGIVIEKEDRTNGEE